MGLIADSFFGPMAWFGLALFMRNHWQEQPRNDIESRYSLHVHLVCLAGPVGVNCQLRSTIELSLTMYHF
jgi:hypothetical protein